MAKNWDYADLSVEVAEQGGVDAFKDKLYNDGKADGYDEGKDDGISEGRTEAYTEMALGLGATIVTAVGAYLYDENKDKIHNFAHECKRKVVKGVQHCKHKTVNFFSKHKPDNES